MGNLLLALVVGVFCFIFGAGWYNDYKIRPILDECQRTLPRNQVCELKAVPVVNTKEIKEKENK